jgi:hypothetical protein
MTPLNLPEPISAYFDADQHDGRAIARCFTRDGRVVDEGRTHSGLAAIQTWKADASARYTYTATPFKLDQHDREYIVTAHVVGDFPGSPTDLRYRFSLKRGKVATLEITA